jgi:outer membrane protein TolC
MIGLAVIFMGLQMGVQVAPDSIPQITLEEALRLSAQVDPDYIAALNRIGDAEWASRAATFAFVTPSLNVSTSATQYSSEFFNIGTGELSSRIIDARAEASYDLFAGLAKVSEAKRSRAALEQAEANEQEARFRTALLTETEYYDVITLRELAGVSRERVGRAQQQLDIARARVLAGGAVQSDTLQLLLELNRARVELLRDEAALKIAREQLGRRVGMAHQVDAAPLGPELSLPLPITEEEAAEEAILNSPRAVAARAAQKAAEAAVGITRSEYLPSVDLFGQWTAFDESFFPEATQRTIYGFRVSLPIWDRGQRELRNQRARTERSIARAKRSDTELEVRLETIRAYQAFVTAREAAKIEREAVRVARENLRIQSERYRTGATTILDLLTSQIEVSEAEAGLVNARQVERLALAGLEALLGRRLF